MKMSDLIIVDQLKEFGTLHVTRLQIMRILMIWWDKVVNIECFKSNRKVKCKISKTGLLVFLGQEMLKSDYATTQESLNQ